MCGEGTPVLAQPPKRDAVAVVVSTGKLGCRKNLSSIYRVGRFLKGMRLHRDLQESFGLKRGCRINTEVMMSASFTTQNALPSQLHYA